MTTENTNINDNVVDDNQVDDVTKVSDEVKTFTQDEVDKLISKRLGREKSKIEKDLKESDDYKGYMNYKESQKTEQDKVNEQLNKYGELETNYNDVVSQLNSYKNNELLSNSNINLDWKELVEVKVGKMVSNEVDFKTALDNFVSDEANAKYLKSNEDDVSSDSNTNTNKITTGKFHNKSSKDKTIAKSILSNLGYGTKK